MNEILSKFPALENVVLGMSKIAEKDSVTSSSWPKVPNLLEVRALPNFILWGKFADGSILEWDVRQYIENATGELIIPLKDFNYFSKVAVEGGGLIHWPNGLDFDADEFYELGKPSQIAASTN